MNNKKVIDLLKDAGNDGSLIIAASILQTLELKEIINIFDKAGNTRASELDPVGISRKRIENHRGASPSIRDEILLIITNKFLITRDVFFTQLYDVSSIEEVQRIYYGCKTIEI